MNWDAIIAVCTGLAAAFTAVMAWYTRKSIAASQAQHRDAHWQSERHHQDAFKPVCVLVLDGGIDKNTRGDALQLERDLSASYIFFFVKCSIKNVGTGPALKLRLGVRFPDKAGYLIWSELPPLGANECNESPLVIPVVLDDAFNETDYQQAPGGLWELWLVYEDVFGNVFHTKHAKNPQQPWAVFGNGDMP